MDKDLDSLLMRYDEMEAEEGNGKQMGLDFITPGVQSSE